MMGFNMKIVAQQLRNAISIQRRITHSYYMGNCTTLCEQVKFSYSKSFKDSDS